MTPRGHNDTIEMRWQYGTIDFFGGCMAEKPVKDYDKFNLRFPDGMREAVAERAKRNGRSMNSEIIEIISNSLFSSSIGNDAVGYILEMSKQNDMANLSDDERDELMSILLQVAGKLTVKIEKESANLRQVLDLISQNKKPI